MLPPDPPFNTFQPPSAETIAAQLILEYLYQHDLLCLTVGDTANMLLVETDREYVELTLTRRIKGRPDPIDASNSWRELADLASHLYKDTPLAGGLAFLKVWSLLK